MAGDLLQESDGTWQQVLSSTRDEHAEGITVYNFQVAGDHTYFVADGAGAEDAVWVHNVCGDLDILQTGGHTIKPATAKQLFDKFAPSRVMHVKEVGKAQENLKEDLGLPPTHQGKIRGDGAYLDSDGTFRGYITDYSPFS